MKFTIQTEQSLGRGFELQLIGQFEDEDLNALWQDLGVKPEDWTQAKGAIKFNDWDFSVIPELPCISRLSSVGIDSCHYRGVDIQKLHEECGRALPALSSEGARKVVLDLVRATASALPSGGVVHVHPFGWPYGDARTATFYPPENTTV